MYPARLDEKGRLKLPVEFQRYLAGLPEKKLFVTSKDRRMATVYPIGIWRENEKVLATSATTPRLCSGYGSRPRIWGRKPKWMGRGGCNFRPTCAGI